MIGDINGLKLVNDGYGHEFGDYHIKKVVEIIRRNVRPQDIVARIGGDEFAILFPNTTTEDVYTIFKNIIEDTRIYNKQKESYVPELSISMGFNTKNNTYTLFQEITKSAENFLNRRKLLERSSSHSDILRSIQTTMFERSQETEEHAERLAQLTHRLGVLFHLSQLELDLLNLFSPLHDIGKVGINDQILKKPGALTEEEWIEMKKHPEIGYRICLSSPELASIADFVLAHHERWDGTGYPLGLKGEQIPILSRILSIVDAYDSMTNDRVYRKALAKESALKEISDKAGTQFDPTIAKTFIKMMEK
jgi:diguanylate cyclase (GGDEF)-like protein